MALEHRLELKMLQKLILTPQLQQAIKLLQMPQLELSQTISNELVENPMLEEITEISVDEKDKNETNEETADEPAAAEADSKDYVEEAEVPVERLNDMSVEDYFDSRGHDGRDLGYFTPDTGVTQSLEQYVSQGADLYEDLFWQLRLSTAADNVKAAAEVVIGNLDENGYLQATDEEIARFAETDKETAAMAVRLVQTFDPPGIAARDLKECLILQLEPLGLRDTLVEKIISTGLEDVEKRRHQQLAQTHGCQVEEILQAVKVIEGLEPKPGRSMSGSQPVYIKPDVYVAWDDGDFRIILNDDNMPHIRINPYYRKLLMNKGALKKDEKEYLDERLRSAVWLLKSLDHRNKTIYRVTECIVNFQRDFFLNGVSNMKPLNLKDVAMELNMHESTISRATSNKYLSCSHGLFGFRYFFSSSVSSATGTVSSASVKDLIGKIIGSENPRKPLSDQKIVEELKKENITVARRTVAKYRDEMNVPPQNLRKRLD